jgi:DNA/RNA non-specific endonuclease
MGIRVSVRMDRMDLIMIILAILVLSFTSKCSASGLRMNGVRLHTEHNFKGKDDFWTFGCKAGCLSMKSRYICDKGTPADSIHTCDPAWNSISSIKLWNYQCLKVFRDFDCEGEPDYVLSTRDSCSRALCNGHPSHMEGCKEDCIIDNVIGSIADCDYDLQTCSRATLRALASNWTISRFGYRRKRVPGVWYQHSTTTGNVVEVQYQTVAGVRVPRRVRTLLLPSGGSCPRTSFRGTEFAQRMADMGAVINDDQGHLLGACLGGPAERWNVAPQTRKLNRGDGRAVNWRKTEIANTRWLRARCNSIRWELELIYARGNPRPESFVLTTTRYSVDPVTGANVVISVDTLDCRNTPNNPLCTASGIVSVLPGGQGGAGCMTYSNVTDGDVFEENMALLEKNAGSLAIAKSHAEHMHEYLRRLAAHDDARDEGTANDGDDDVSLKDIATLNNTHDARSQYETLQYNAADNMTVQGDVSSTSDDGSSTSDDGSSTSDDGSSTSDDGSSTSDDDDDDDLFSTFSEDDGDDVPISSDVAALKNADDRDVAAINETLQLQLQSLLSLQHQLRMLAQRRQPRRKQKQRQPQQQQQEKEQQQEQQQEQEQEQQQEQEQEQQQEQEQEQQQQEQQQEQEREQEQEQEEREQ